MKHIKLGWVEKFQDLVASEKSDKAVIKEFLMYAVDKEEAFNKAWEQNRAKVI